MSETRFTPGPWVARRDGDAITMSSPDLSWTDFAQVWVRLEDELADDPVGVANAHLIAAAPTLYDTAAETVSALRRLISEMNLGPDGEGRDWLDMLTACADDLDAAMAKARGEAA